MLEPASDLGFENEAAPRPNVIGPLGAHLLESHVALQFGIAGHVDLAEAAGGVKPADLVARRRGRAGRH
jgi:hypothetical protein